MPSGKDRAETATTAFTQNYADFQYRFVEFLVEHLSDVSREFRGDLQMPMILAIIGQVKIHSLPRSGTKVSDGPGSAAISASRIADVTGISRQTVRRKLAELERLGWIEQLADRSWRLKGDAGGSAAQDDLAQLDSRAIARVGVLYAGLESIVNSRS